jgi:hypothetical protein
MVEAVPYVHPKLAVTAIVDGQDFATQLERAISRSKPKVIEAPPKGIAPKSLADKIEEIEPIILVPDRRYRISCNRCCFSRDAWRARTVFRSDSDVMERLAQSS